MTTMGNETEQNTFVDFVEVCGDCGSLIVWLPDGSAKCDCGKCDLQFIEKKKAIELGILKGE